MKSLVFKVILVPLVAAGLAAGAAAQDSEQEDLPPRYPDRLPKMTTECMFFRTIYDWKALDPYNLIVYFNNRHTPRHIELETACYSARFVETIAFTSNNDGRLCAFGGDSVIIGDMECTIGAMHKMTSEEADELIAKYKPRYRKKPKDGKKADGE